MSSIDIVLSQFQFTDYVIKANVGDVTYEESLVQPTPAGNCLNWVLGHIVATRCNLLRSLGAQAYWDEADCKRYDRHGAPITKTGDARPLDELWAGLDETLSSIQSTVSKFTPEKMAEKAPFSPTNNPDETYGSLLATCAFHDAYHAGQTGVLRRIIGKAPADL